MGASDGGEFMIGQAVLLATSAAIAAYLVVVMLFPERF